MYCFKNNLKFGFCQFYKIERKCLPDNLSLMLKVKFVKYYFGNLF